MFSRIDPIIAAAHSGGTILKKYFGQSLDTVQKSSAADFRTKADTESEAAIIAVLTKHFPDYNIVGEETGETSKDSDFTFYIDPLDGTNNFVLTLPNFSVSIGLFHKDEIVAAVIFQPVIDQTFYAIKGQGAFLEGKKLSVSKETDIKKATICNCVGYDIETKDEMQVVCALYEKEAKRVTSNWSPTFDFCMLACGRVEAMVSNMNEIYDFAAGKLIATEAGALLTDFKGVPESNNRTQKFLVSNTIEIQKHLIEIVKHL